MDLNVTSMAFLVAGLTLLYAASKNMYPQDVIRKAMGKDPIHGPIVGQWSVGKKLEPTANVGPLINTPGQVIATV